MYYNTFKVWYKIGDTMYKSILKNATDIGIINILSEKHCISRLCIDIIKKEKMREV